MKKTIILCFLAPLLLLAQQGPAKKPTLMVVPSDAWCNENGYMMEFQDEGQKRRIADYRAAVLDLDLLAVIAQVNTILAERGFPAKSLEQEMKALEFDEGFDEVSSGGDGSGVYESPIDQLLKRAQSDIILQLTWKVNQAGPKRSITFSLQGLDAYTNKEIATISGTGAPSFESEVPRLLEEAVVKDMDNWLDRLQRHFDDMFTNGREITIRVRVWDSFDGDLYNEYNGTELGEIIEDWLYDNCVQGRYSTTTYTDTYLYFEQVRMPLFDERGRAIDARRWVRDLQKYLQSPPFNIPIRLDTKGLGQAILTLGAK